MDFRTNLPPIGNHFSKVDSFVSKYGQASIDTQVALQPEHVDVPTGRRLNYHLSQQNLAPYQQMMIDPQMQQQDPQMQQQQSAGTPSSHAQNSIFGGGGKKHQLINSTRNIQPQISMPTASSTPGGYLQQTYGGVLPQQSSVLQAHYDSQRQLPSLQELNGLGSPNGLPFNVRMGGAMPSQGLDGRNHMLVSRNNTKVVYEDPLDRKRRERQARILQERAEMASMQGMPLSNRTRNSEGYRGNYSQSVINSLQQPSLILQPHQMQQANNFPATNRGMLQQKPSSYGRSGSGRQLQRVTTAPSNFSQGYLNYQSAPPIQYPQTPRLNLGVSELDDTLPTHVRNAMTTRNHNEVAGKIGHPERQIEQELMSSVPISQPQPHANYSFANPPSPHSYAQQLSHQPAPNHRSNLSQYQNLATQASHRQLPPILKQQQSSGVDRMVFSPVEQRQQYSSSIPLNPAIPYLQPPVMPQLQQQNRPITPRSLKPLRPHQSSQLNVAIASDEMGQQHFQEEKVTNLESTQQMQDRFDKQDIQRIVLEQQIAEKRAKRMAEKQKDLQDEQRDDQRWRSDMSNEERPHSRQKRESNAYTPNIGTISVCDGSFNGDEHEDLDRSRSGRPLTQKEKNIRHARSAAYKKQRSNTLPHRQEQQEWDIRPKLMVVSNLDEGNDNNHVQNHINFMNNETQNNKIQKRPSSGNILDQSRQAVDLIQGQFKDELNNFRKEMADQIQQEFTQVFQGLNQHAQKMVSAQSAKELILDYQPYDQERIQNLKNSIKPSAEQDQENPERNQKHGESMGFMGQSMEAETRFIGTHEDPDNPKSKKTKSFVQTLPLKSGTAFETPKKLVSPYKHRPYAVSKFLTQKQSSAMVGAQIDDDSLEDVLKDVHLNAGTLHDIEHCKILNEQAEQNLLQRSASPVHISLQPQRAYDEPTDIPNLKKYDEEWHRTMQEPLPIYFNPDGTRTNQAI